MYEHGEGISIVVQGPISTFIKDSLASIRANMPKSEIVISTWRSEDTTGLDYDKLVLSVDPGHTPLNTMRQIVGNQVGIAAASNDMVLKARTDTMLLGNSFLEHIGRWEDRRGAFRIFDKRILVPNVGTSDPDVHVCYQASDLAMLGMKADLMFLYDVPIGPSATTLKSSEQYIWMSAIQKKFPSWEIDDINHRPPDAIANTRRFMADNIVVLNAREQFRMYCGKHVKVPDDEMVTMKHNKWKEWYLELPEVA